MSQTTKEINKITATVIGVAGRLVVYALVILLLYEGVTKGFEFGHAIFYETSVAQAPGTDREVTVKEGASVSGVAELLKEKGLLTNEYAFIIQSKFYEYEVNPGTYTFNTSMSSKEMLQMMDENVKEEEDGEDKK